MAEESVYSFTEGISEGLTEGFTEGISFGLEEKFQIVQKMVWYIKNSKERFTEEDQMD